MNQNDISAILPVEGIKQQHYIKSAQIPSLPLEGEASDQYTLASTQFAGIFYCKRSMKSLLQQRSLICEFLKLRLKPTAKKIQTQIPMEDMYNLIGELFRESPTPFDPLHFVFILDYGIAYGFFSGDGKFVPMCKKCNFSIYVAIRANNVKIVCCNPKCKTKILGESTIFSDDKPKKKQIKSNVKLPSIKTDSNRSEASRLSGQQKQRQLTSQELNMIRKTAKKITYS